MYSISTYTVCVYLSIQCISVYIYIYIYPKCKIHDRPNRPLSSPPHNFHSCTESNIAKQNIVHFRMLVFRTKIDKSFFFLVPVLKNEWTNVIWIAVINHCLFLLGNKTTANFTVGHVSRVIFINQRFQTHYLIFSGYQMLLAVLQTAKVAPLINFRKTQTNGGIPRNNDKNIWRVLSNESSRFTAKWTCSSEQPCDSAESACDWFDFGLEASSEFAQVTEPHSAHHPQSVQECTRPWRQGNILYPFQKQCHEYTSLAI